MQKSIRLLVALITGFCLLHESAATTVQYDYTATVYLEIRGNQLATPEQMFFSPSAPVSGSFTYDNAVPGFPAPPFGTFYGAVSNLEGMIDGNGFSDPVGGIVSINDGFDFNPGDPNEPLTDLLIILLDGDFGTPDLNGFSVNNGGITFNLVNVRLFWITPDGGFLSDESLPADLLLQTEIARIAFDFEDANDANNTHTVFAEPLLLSAAPVPLPGAAWLLLSAIGLLGVNRTKRV